MSKSREKSEPGTPAQATPAPGESGATIRLHESAHCMGLLHDSGQVANSHAPSGPRDTASGGRGRAWAASPASTCNRAVNSLATEWRGLESNGGRAHWRPVLYSEQMLVSPTENPGQHCAVNPGVAH